MNIETLRHSVYLYFYNLPKPRMEKSEIILLMKYYKKTTHYLEFGMGGSTLLACKFKNIKNIYSVEASEKWINTLKHHTKHLQKNRLIIDYVDINGDDDFWSYPKDDSKKSNWPKYYNPWQKIPFEPDFILIDGRFRVACLLHILLKMKSLVFIAIHDYSIRENYHIVEKYLDIVECKETLYIFKIKPNIDMEEISTVGISFENDSR